MKLLKLIFQGYRNIMENCHNNAMVLKEGLEKTGLFNILSKDIGVPVVAFSLKDKSRYTEFQVSETLRRFGWIVPAYPMPADAQHVALLRVVIREDFSRTLAERLVVDIIKVLEELDKHYIPAAPKTTKGDGKNGTVVNKTAEEIKREITEHWMNMVAANKANMLTPATERCSVVEIVANGTCER